MDLIIPHSLLTQYLKTNAAPDEIARCLSLCGPTVDQLEKIGNDWLYHIEVITNRVDAASVYGIAREAAAILPQFNHRAALMPLELEYLKTQVSSSSLPPLDLKIQNNAKLNSRIVALKLSGVKVKPSPAWLQEALVKMGQRPLNNIIDITNYVMFELGHPVHAFDYDRLVQKTILVREAKAGEKLTTLDSKQHTLSGGEIVYDDGTGTIIDLPGIMGTQNTVITDKTQTVLFWIESNHGAKIRFASLKHQIRSHAAILNEKNVDPELALPAILRAAQLALAVTKGTFTARLTDIYSTKPQLKSVDLNLDWLSQFAGISIPGKKVIAILSALGFTVNPSGSSLTCQVPSWRLADINRPEDLAEEITRIYGYYRLPSIIPCTDLPQTSTWPLLEREYQARLYLVHLGFTEIYNSPLISQDICAQSGISTAPLFRLKNPLSADYVFMRSSLLPSLLNNLKNNLGTAAPPFWLFELANCYFKSPKGPLAQERSTLAIVQYPGDFSVLKGFLQALTRQSRLRPDFIPEKPATALYHPKISARIELNDHKLGHLGLLNPKNSGNFNLSLSVAIAEIDFNQLNELAIPLYTFKPIPKFPAVIEDLTFTLPQKTHVGPLIKLAATTDPGIAEVQLKSTYQQNVTLTLFYQAADHTLTQNEVAAIRFKVVSLIKQKFNTALVGNLNHP